MKLALAYILELLAIKLMQFKDKRLNIGWMDSLFFEETVERVHQFLSFCSLILIYLIINDFDACLWVIYYEASCRFL
jgi:hypothetical protein